MTYEMVSATRDKGFGSSIGIVRSRFQVTVIANTASSLAAVREQVIAATDFWRDPASSPEILHADPELQTQSYEAEVGLYQAVVDVTIMYRG